VHFFDSISAIAIRSILWDFGDGKSSALHHPEHTYSEPGSYSVSLTATTADGQSFTEKRNNLIKVHASPVATFSVTPEKAILSNATMEFTNGSKNNTSKTFYAWDFGDHSTVSKKKSPSHIYLDTGRFMVTLTVRNEYKCQDEYRKSVVVLEDVKVFIPDIFRPDNAHASVNSKFKVVASGITEFHLYIFDRKGTLFYESDDYDSHGWDGNSVYGMAPVGSYVYKLKVKGRDGNYYDFNGVVNLIR